MLIQICTVSYLQPGINYNIACILINIYVYGSKVTVFTNE